MTYSKPRTIHRCTINLGSVSICTETLKRA